MSSRCANLAGLCAVAIVGAGTCGTAQATERNAAQAVVTAASAASDAPAAPTPSATQRPKIGLVLSGGGARGLAHVGVLKVLERERIPVDLIVGTSMGAIIGGLYASGMGADQIERDLRAVRWDEVFAPRVGRQELSQRRKEQDFENSAVVELGWRDGELRTPVAAVSSRGLETLLRRFTLPVRQVTQFARLPIPFRAVATDMETGAAVELAEGDLAVAMRSSMSVPGVFAPIEYGGQVLGDGGLVDNLPVALARRMGADIVIAVNVGTPLAGREALGSAVGVTTQMINILTEQNVQRSVAALRERDVLLTPVLGKLGSGDFDRAFDLMKLGEGAAQDALQKLAPLALSESLYAQWSAAHVAPLPQPANLGFVAFEGTTATNPQRFSAQLESQPGQPFDPARAERDARRLAATGDYIRADYRVVRTPAGEGLLFDLEDKPWGPNYLRAGLDLSTDFAGRSSFNLKLAHDRHWLTPNGTEWRNRLNLGESPMLSSELYHPLNWTQSLSSDWFVAGHVFGESRRLTLYDLGGGQLGLFDRITLRIGADLGQPWSDLGEVRLGVQRESRRTKPYLLDASYTGPRDATIEHETGARVRVVVDQLDYALFPQRGYRVEAQGVLGQRSSAGLTEPFHSVQASGTYVRTFGRHTVNLYALMLLSDQANAAPLVGRQSLGGFHLMSGYQPGQISGNQLLFGRLTWYMRLNQPLALTRGFFLGGTLEAGNAWLQRSQISPYDLRGSASVFLGADTAIGPMYLGLVSAPGGTTGLMFFIGRP
jgi:NTE family protein